jgi:probable DNA metabolism protein
VSDRPALVYCYDGSFDGLLCCVFESYAQREVPSDILPEGALLPLLLPIKAVETDGERARRVLSSIPRKLGRDAPGFIRRAFLTCHPQKEILILRFLRLGFSAGPLVMRMLTDDTVHALTAAVRHLENEAHLFRGFVRFSETNGALTAQIAPRNIVLPLIARHFCERFPGERFLIHDKTHGMALVHEHGKWMITAAQRLELPGPDADELKFRALWRLFYNTIEIKERRNPRCRMCHMPKRYWDCMTELARDNALPAPPG